MKIFMLILSIISLNICAQEVAKLKEIPFEPLNSFQYDLGNAATISKTIDKLVKQTSVKFNLSVPRGLLNRKITIKDKKHYFKIIERITNNLNASFCYLNAYEFNLNAENKILSFGTFASENFFVNYRLSPLTNNKNKTLFSTTLIADWRALQIIKGSCYIIQNNKTYKLNDDSFSKKGVVQFSKVLNNFDINKEYKIKIKITAEKHTAVGLVFTPIENEIFSGEYFALKTGKELDKSTYPFFPVTISFANLFSDKEWNLLNTSYKTGRSNKEIKKIAERIPPIMGVYHFKDNLPIKRVGSYAIDPPTFQPTIEIQLPHGMINNVKTRLGIILFLKDEGNLIKTFSYSVKP